MSFFDDLIKEIDVNDDDLKVFLVLGKSIYLCGKFKILDFDNSYIYLLVNNEKYKVLGSDINIKSLSKNEVFVLGNILSFVKE